MGLLPRDLRFRRPFIIGTGANRRLICRPLQLWRMINVKKLLPFSLRPAKGTLDMILPRLRAHLCDIAKNGSPVTYQALASALDLVPPNTIHQLTVALEALIQEDAAAARPLIAALVISKARGGLPAPGFFECAQRVGRFQGDPSGPEAPAFHATEFQRAVEFWRAPQATG